jgi:hypothetical protein
MGRLAHNKPIADGTGQTSDGLELGVTLWGRADAVTGLELYEMAGFVTSLPVVSTLRAW